jgi:vancomycin permeability regulator SanA
MRKYALAICALVVVLGLLFVIFTALNREVVHSASEQSIYRCGEEGTVKKKYDAIVVLGAGIRDDGSPSHMLEDRLRGAVALYKGGVADTVILSGDNSGEHYDEVSAMVRYCLENGVPESAIVRDDKGFSTYETMYNCSVSGEYKSIIAVTQEYHLYRAMYLGIELGMDVDGFAADYRTYRGQIFRDLREYFARVKDFFAVGLLTEK